MSTVIPRVLKGFEKSITASLSKLILSGAIDIVAF